MNIRWKQIIMLSVFIASLMLSAFSVKETVKAAGTETRITLSPSAQYPTATGKAKYKVDGTQREFQVEVENVRRLAGQRLNVFVNGTKVGSFLVTSLGAGRLDLRGSSAPIIRAGMPMSVRTAAGILVVSGRF